MSATPDNEPELTLRFSHGEESAMRQLYDHFYSPLVFFAYQLITNRPQAEDIVMDAFEKLWHRRATFQRYSAIKGFLYITIKNACFDYLDHLKVRIKTKPAILALADSEEDFIEANIIFAELMQIIYKELTQLPPQYAEVLRLLYIDNLSNEEAAEQLKLSPANLRIRKFRALEQLRKVLTQKEILLILVNFL